MWMARTFCFVIIFSLPKSLHKICFGWTTTILAQTILIPKNRLSQFLMCWNLNWMQNSDFAEFFQILSDFEDFLRYRRIKTENNDRFSTSKTMKQKLFPIHRYSMAIGFSFYCKWILNAAYYRWIKKIW